MNAETETAIQNLSKAFADTAELLSTMKRIANFVVARVTSRFKDVSIARDGYIQAVFPGFR